MWLCPKKTTVASVWASSSWSPSVGSAMKVSMSSWGDAWHTSASSSDTEGGRLNRRSTRPPPSSTPAVLDLPVHQVVVGRVGGVLQPAVGVAPDPRAAQSLDPLDALFGKGPGQGVVAAEHKLVRARGAGVGDHRLERREVAVDVVQQGAHGPASHYDCARSDGWPAPGHGARISTRRASLVARTS